MALFATQSEGEGAEVYEETVCISGAPQNSPRPPLFPFRQIDASHGIGTEMPGTPQPMSPALSTAPLINLLHSSVQGRQAPNIPRGRHLRGDHVIYDVDARKAGDAQAQLEVSPITVYSSETALALGRQIAVNKKFVCYGLRGGPIRILNINNSQRVLLRGHTQVSTCIFLWHSYTSIFVAEELQRHASSPRFNDCNVRLFISSSVGTCNTNVFFFHVAAGD